MPGAAIVIEIDAADAASKHARALIDACNHGPYAALTCTLSTDTETDPPAALAVVKWDDLQHLSVSVQVGVRRRDGADWSVRQLRFVESDVEHERWRTIGLVIATLVGQASAPTSAEPVTAESAPAPASQARAPQKDTLIPSPRFQPSAWWLGGELGLSRGAAGSAGALGAGLRLGRRLGSGPFFVDGTFQFETEQPAPEVTLRWLHAGLDGGASVLLFPRVYVETRVGAAWTSLAAVASSGELVGSSSGALWSLRQGLGLTWWWSHWIGVSISGELSETQRRSVVRVVGPGGEAERLLTVEQVGWGARTGLRLGF